MGAASVPDETRTRAGRRRIHRARVPGAAGALAERAGAGQAGQRAEQHLDIRKLPGHRDIVRLREHGGPRAGGAQERQGVPDAATRRVGQGDRADRVHGEFGGDRVLASGQPQRHHVPCAEPRIGEHRADTADFGVQSRVGEAATCRFAGPHDRLAGGVEPHTEAEEGVEVAAGRQPPLGPGAAVVAGHAVGEGHPVA